MKKCCPKPSKATLNIPEIQVISGNQTSPRSDRWVHSDPFWQLETQWYTFLYVKKIGISKKWKMRFLDCASFSKLRFWRVIVTRPHAKLRKFVPDGFQTFSIFFTLTIVWSNPVSQEIAIWPAIFDISVTFGSKSLSQFFLQNLQNLYDLVAGHGGKRDQE